ncbi:MAG: alpha/beta hydrolase, partial [Kribbellaceae bacterium]|nr:alpha/beta hydrolase [Kribbellaceae bacterium]
MTYEILPPSQEGRVAFGDGETWYRITGKLGSGVTPLVVAHGGPGA